MVTDPIDGVNFKTCDEIGTFTSISGEQADFPCAGYLIDIFPSNTDPDGFREQINSHLEMLFGDPARGLNMELTLYSPRANWWTYVQILYEYGIQGEQVLNRPTSNYQTFRLNIYQTSGDTATL